MAAQIDDYAQMVEEFSTFPCFYVVYVNWSYIIGRGKIFRLKLVVINIICILCKKDIWS